MRTKRRATVESSVERKTKELKYSGNLKGNMENRCNQQKAEQLGTIWAEN